MKRVLWISIFLFAYINSYGWKYVTPPQNGVTITGFVRSNGVGIQGVQVSDGIDFATTDSLGQYMLRSSKYSDAVFVVTPNGYEPKMAKGVLPLSWAPLNSAKAQKCEEHNFELIQVDNNSYRVAMLGCLRLSNRNDDIFQLKHNLIPSIKQLKEEDNRAMYSIFLGDLSTNSLWYSAEFDIEDAVKTLVSQHYPTPFYTVIGDMDHDGAVPNSILTDHLAERMYVYSAAPRNYSFNIGQIHYVVLDNTSFLNEAGDGKYPTEIVGKRNFNKEITTDQLEWLKKDLHFVDSTTPIVICMHQNFMRVGSNGTTTLLFDKHENATQLLHCLKEYKNVHLFTAHSARKQVFVSKEYPNITEHCLPMACGNGWETGYNGYISLCADGTPAGAEVLNCNGKQLSWSYYSFEEKAPLRVYDMAEVAKYYTDNQDVRKFFREYKTRTDYGSTEFANYIYINYWGYEPKSKLEVKCGEKGLKVRAVMQDDPLYTIIQTVTDFKLSRKKPRVTRNTSPHLFRVKTAQLTDTITIRATNPFGVVFEQQYIRPIEFNPQPIRK